jgi:hypothetical protein
MSDNYDFVVDSLEFIHVNLLKKMKFMIHYSNTVIFSIIKNMAQV